MIRFFFKKKDKSIPYREVLELTNDSIVMTDKFGSFKYVNQSFLNMIGVDCPKLILDEKLYSFSATDRPKDDYEKIISTVDEGVFFDFPLRTSKQQLILCNARFHVVRGQLFFFFEDKSKQKARENTLIREAKIDKLTGLFNRNGFDERLGSSIRDYDTNSSFNVGVLFIDLDGFKAVNDTYGHDAGDLLLINVAESLTGSLEVFETAARLGGDEFVCILPLCSSTVELKEKARKILNSVACPVNINNQVLTVKCSIGGSIMVDGDDILSLLKRADLAMYMAKKAGKNQIKILSV